MDLRLKDGRDEAIINSLTQKVTQISRDLQRIRSETKANADRICSVETAVDTVLSQTNTEGLHAGSIICNSTILHFTQDLIVTSIIPLHYFL